MFLFCLNSFCLFEFFISFHVFLVVALEFGSKRTFSDFKHFFLCCLDIDLFQGFLILSHFLIRVYIDREIGMKPYSYLKS